MSRKLEKDLELKSEARYPGPERLAKSSGSLVIQSYYLQVQYHVRKLLNSFVSPKSVAVIHERARSYPSPWRVEIVLPRRAICGLSSATN